MASLLPLISYELLATTRTLSLHVPVPVGNVRVPSDDLVCRGALRQRGERAQPVREILPLVDVNH